MYAAGDIIGAPALASVAYDHGRFAVEHLLTGKTDPGRATLAPNGIYTLPVEGPHLRYFINTTFNHPTMAEAYRVAAHNGLNRLA